MSGYPLLLFPILVFAGLVVLVISDRRHRRQPMRGFRECPYWIQGWKKNRVYPDFIFARERTGKTDKILVWETKGDQLEGNLDTTYKRKLLETLSANYRAEDGIKAGTLQLVGQAGEAVECDLILMSEWKTEVLKKLEGK